MSLPPGMNKDSIYNFALPFVRSINTVYRQFTDFHDAVMYDLSINGQVCYLRKALNDTFDNSLRRITLEDATRYDRDYIALIAEERPLFLPDAPAMPVYIETDAEFADTGQDFNVKLNGVTLSASQEARMKAFLFKYKLASKRFKIIA